MKLNFYLVIFFNIILWLVSGTNRMGVSAEVGEDQMEGEARLGVSADVGEDDRLDRQPADRTQLVSLLQLPGADVAGHQVSGSSVDDAAVLRPGLADEAGVQTRVRQPPLPRHAALQLGDRGWRRKRSWRCRRSGWGRREKLLGVDGGGVGGGGLGVRSPELLL